MLIKYSGKYVKIYSNMKITYLLFVTNMKVEVGKNPSGKPLKPPGNPEEPFWCLGFRVGRIT